MTDQIIGLGIIVTLIFMLGLLNSFCRCSLNSDQFVYWFVSIFWCSSRLMFIILVFVLVFQNLLFKVLSRTFLVFLTDMFAIFLRVFLTLLVLGGCLSHGSLGGLTFTHGHFFLNCLIKILNSFFFSSWLLRTMVCFILSLLLPNVLIELIYLWYFLLKLSFFYAPP